MISNNKDWIDVLKGIGIILIVIGHIYKDILHDIIYLFHVPLFFFISGYLYRQPDNIYIYCIKKINNLLVPYICFLLIFTLILVIEAFFSHKPINIIYSYLTNALMGGKSLSGWLSVFWFITCLFITQVLFSILSVLNKKHLAYANIFSLILAYLNSYAVPDYYLFWSLNIVFYSLPIYYIGNLFSKIESKILINNIATISIFTLIPFYYINSELLITDMKSARYGLPIISIIFSTSIIIFLFSLSKKITKFKGYSKWLVYLGSSSMTIMYLHQPIQISLKHIIGMHSDINLTIITLILCSISHFFISKNRLLSRYLLGRT